MFIDNELVFGTAFAPGAVGTNIFTNTYDTSPLGNNVNTNAFTERGAGEDTFIYISIVATILASGGASSVAFAFVTDTIAALTTPATIIMQTAAIPKATLLIGRELFMTVWRGSLLTSLYKRYIGMACIVTTNDVTTGTVYAAMVKVAQDKTIYQPGFTVK